MGEGPSREASPCPDFNFNFNFNHFNSVLKVQAMTAESIKGGGGLNEYYGRKRLTKLLARGNVAASTCICFNP